MALSNPSIWEKVEQVDLTSIRGLIVEGGYSTLEADRMELDYRQFLYLVAIYGDQLIPSRDVDEFWHEHILQTEKYASDCEYIFGHFVHHSSFSREQTQRDGRWEGRTKDDLVEAYSKTVSLCEQEFDVPFYGESARCCNSLHGLHR